MRELRRTRSRQQLAVLRPVRGAAQRRAGNTAGTADLPGLRGCCLRQESPVLRCVRRIARKKGLPGLRDPLLPHTQSSAPGAARHIYPLFRAPGSWAPRRHQLPHPHHYLHLSRNPNLSWSGSGKGACPYPEDPSEEWDPWTDGDPTYDVSAPLPRQPQKQYTDLQRVADEMAARSAPRPVPHEEPQLAQISVPGKKYSHLPLIADELKVDLERRAAPEDTDGGRPAQGKRGKKKGLFG